MFAAIANYLWLYIFIDIEMKPTPIYHGITECYLLLEFRGSFKIENGFGIEGDFVLVGHFAGTQYLSYLNLL